MTTRRWVRIAAVTTLAVGATLAATASPALALPRACDQLMQRIDDDWDHVNEWAAWAGIARHDSDWQDFTEDEEMVQYWAKVAQADTAAAQRAHCY